jgi:hypothetical protein
MQIDPPFSGLDSPHLPKSAGLEPLLKVGIVQLVHNSDFFSEAMVSGVNFKHKHLNKPPTCCSDEWLALLCRQAWSQAAGAFESVSTSTLNVNYPLSLLEEWSSSVNTNLSTLYVDHS